MNGAIYEIEPGKFVVEFVVRKVVTEVHKDLDNGDVEVTWRSPIPETGKELVLCELFPQGRLDEVDLGPSEIPGMRLVHLSLEDRREGLIPAFQAGLGAELYSDPVFYRKFVDYMVAAEQARKAAGAVDPIAGGA